MITIDKLDVETNSPNFYYKEYMGDGEEKIHVDIGVQRIKLCHTAK